MNQNNYLMEKCRDYGYVRTSSWLNYGTHSLVVKDTTTGAQLTLGKDFMVEITRNADGETGFKVSFIGAYAKTVMPST